MSKSDAEPSGKSDPEPSGGVTRRGLLWGGIAAGAGAALVVGADRALAAASDAGRQDGLDEAAGANGRGVIPFYGEHQAGVEMIPQSHQSLMAFRLLPETDRDALRRMMRVVSDDASRLTQGQFALADSEPELALIPAHLTITFGFGPEFVRRVNPGALPSWLAPLPAFQIDRLEERWTGGDLLVQVAADDALTVAHAQRMVAKDLRSFATVQWLQTGFRRAYGSAESGMTQRNLFGQLDGTVNMVPGSEDFADVVWRGPDAHPEWMTGGTGMVVRRIRMLLDKWDRLDRTGREQSVGRKISSGAPLTGTLEHDEPDFEATTPVGFPVIPEFAHVRRARSDDTHERIFRRGYNYDVEATDGGLSDSGLIFTSFQHDVGSQFLPIQRRLDELDLLNEWITPIGSAVFVIPPGCQPGGYIGETLLA